MPHDQSAGVKEAKKKTSRIGELGSQVIEAGKRIFGAPGKSLKEAAGNRGGAKMPSKSSLTFKFKNRPLPAGSPAAKAAESMRSREKRTSGKTR